MPKVQPGRPNATRYSVACVAYGDSRLVALAVQDAVVVYRNVDEFIQTLRCRGFVSALALDARTGKARHISLLAACSPNSIECFQLDNPEHGVKWIPVSSASCDADTTCLSWGMNDELLSGNQSILLHMFQSQEPELLWKIELANRLRALTFSPDGSLFASLGEYDKTIKVWHRIPTPTQPDFSFVYLSLPRVVVHMQWKLPIHVEQDMENVLFTITIDNTVTAWAPINSWEPHILYQRASVSMHSPQFDGVSSKPHLSHFWILVDNSELTRALETVFNRSDREKNPISDEFETITDIARKSPEVCLALDQTDDRLLVWGIDQLDSKTGKPVGTFQILERNLPSGWLSRIAPYSLFWAFCVGPHGFADLLIVQHTLEGRVHVLEADVTAILAESNKKPVRRRIDWLGHTKSGAMLSRTVDGLGLLSRAPEGDSIAWGLDRQGMIRQRSILPFNNTCLSVTLLAGQYCLSLSNRNIELWCSLQCPAIKIHSLEVNATGTFMCFLQVPRATNDGEVRKFLAITDAKESFAWCVDFEPIHHDSSSSNKLRIELVSSGVFPSVDDLHIVSAVDPMGWSATINSESLDSFTREVLITVSSEGRLQTWTTNFSRASKSPRWLNLSSIPTNISRPSLAHGTSERKVAMGMTSPGFSNVTVDGSGNELTIWDTRVSRFSVHEEYRKTFPCEDIIRDLDWTSTPDSQSILAVGFPRRVVLFCQQRYDYLNSGSMWISFMSFDMHGLTEYRISDSIWLDQGSLAVAAGPQIYLFDRTIQNLDIRGNTHLDIHNYQIKTIFEMCRRLNGPLPVYHPQFLQQAILAGKLQLVKKLLDKLENVLRSEMMNDNSHDKDYLMDTFLDTSLQEFTERGEEDVTGATGLQSFQFPPVNSPFADSAPPTETLSNLLERTSLPYITSTEQIQLAMIVDCMSEFEQHHRSLDLNASRYFLFFRQSVLLRRSKMKFDAQLSLRDILWAFHSHSQEVLADLVSRTYAKPIIWKNAKEAGLFLWIRSIDLLKLKMEMLARNQYAQTEERNPVDCSLFYLALRKKTLLAGLWRSAGWHSEQPPMVKFLSHDFNDSRWRTAASKNAYALLAKQRYEYAAAFFLLADSLKDAVNVCLRNLNDLQLAVGIARAYEGDDGPVLRYVIEEHVLPRAVSTGDRWLASWAFWMIGDRGKSVQALLLPLDDLILFAAKRPTIIQIDDPALVVLYRQLKDKTLQTIQAAAQISPKLEFDYILRIAALYDRLGCDLLALDLVKNWDFTTETRSTAPSFTSRRRSTIDDISVSRFRDRGGRHELAKVPATVPEESSLLDSFEFGF